MRIEDVEKFCEIEGKCWIWTRGCDSHGIPIMRLSDGPQYVRRSMRAHTDGAPIAPRYVVTSTCDNILCVSPHCSIKVSRKTSAKMALARGAFGHRANIARSAATRASRSKYTPEIVRMVRESKESLREIVLSTGMSARHAQAIQQGIRRRDNNDPFTQLLR
jgi:hypothetical protein